MPSCSLVAGADNQQIHEENQDHRAQYGQHHQSQLNGAQQAGFIGIVTLDTQHQAIDHAHIILHRGAAFRQQTPALLGITACQHPFQQGPDMSLPFHPEPRHLAPHAHILGQQQGAGWVALFQLIKRFLEGGHFPLHLAFHAHLIQLEMNVVSQQVDQSIGAHALATGIIDRRSAPFQLPGNVQGQADCSKRNAEKGEQDAHQFRTQGVEGFNHRCVRHPGTAG